MNNNIVDIIAPVYIDGKVYKQINHVIPPVYESII